MNDNFNANFQRRDHLRNDQRMPKCFKDTERVIKSVKSCKSNFKTVLANSRFRGNHFKKIYSLTLNVLKHYDYLQKIIENLKLLEKEKMLRQEIASILIYEILFGNGNLPGESKPILTIKKYKNDILRVHQDLQCSDEQIFSTKVINLPRYARVHTLVTTVPYVIRDLQGFGFQEIKYSEDISEERYIDLIGNLDRGCFVIDLHFKDLLVFAYFENLTNLELYLKGHIFLQDKSSYIPVHVLNPEPGSAVLDACAAPGMKSVHIASKMENKGLLIACERDKVRFETLKETLEYGAVKISKIFCKDFKSMDPNDQAYSCIDYILIDPSCSGSGMVNRMDQVTDTEDSKNKERLQKLAGFQIILLKHALKFPSVKRVVYSTCSIHEWENEYVVHEALAAFSYLFKLVPVMPGWAERGLETYEHGKMCLRTVPEKHLMNGFFVAMFERLSDSEINYMNMNCEKEFSKNSKKEKKKNKHMKGKDSISSENFINSTKLSHFKESCADNLEIGDSFLTGNYKRKRDYSNEKYIGQDSNQQFIDDEVSSKKRKKRRSIEMNLAEISNQQLTKDSVLYNKQKKRKQRIENDEVESSNQWLINKSTLCDEKRSETCTVENNTAKHSKQHFTDEKQLLHIKKKKKEKSTKGVTESPNQHFIDDNVLCDLNKIQKFEISGFESSNQQFIDDSQLTYNKKKKKDKKIEKNIDEISNQELIDDDSMLCSKRRGKKQNGKNNLADNLNQQFTDESQLTYKKKKKKDKTVEKNIDKISNQYLIDDATELGNKRKEKKQNTENNIAENSNQQFTDESQPTYKKKKDKRVEKNINESSNQHLIDDDTELYNKRREKKQNSENNIAGNSNQQLADDSQPTYKKKKDKDKRVEKNINESSNQQLVDEYTALCSKRREKKQNIENDTAESSDPQFTNESQLTCKKHKKKRKDKSVEKDKNENSNQQSLDDLVSCNKERKKKLRNKNYVTASSNDQFTDERQLIYSKKKDKRTLKGVIESSNQLFSGGDKKIKVSQKVENCVTENLKQQFIDKIGFKDSKDKENDIIKDERIKNFSNALLCVEKVKNMSNTNFRDNSSPCNPIDLTMEHQKRKKKKKHSRT